MIKTNKKMVILVAKLVDKKGNLEIGGIESYVLQLVEVFKKEFEIIIYQFKGFEIDIEFRDFRVIGKTESTKQIIKNNIRPSLYEDDIVIISTEQLNIKSFWDKTVIIQHGIYWDLPIKYYSKSLIGKFFPHIFKLIDSYRNLRRINSFKFIVCVDYIYKTWFKSLVDDNGDKKFFVIPNHASIDFFENESNNDNDNDVNILFARRFMSFRGTIQFCEVCVDLLNEFNNVNITLCGSGPDEVKMKKILPESKNVKYIVSQYKDMHKVISNQSLIIVPSLGSEGTSLSAIEGMAMGKVVISSDVGGLSNIIIDGYNGYLYDPKDLRELKKKIIEIIKNEKLRNEIGSNAKEVAMKSLSFDQWSTKWISVVEQLSNKYKKN